MLRSYRNILCVGWLSLVAGCALAQELRPDPSYEIQLRSRTFTPLPGIDVGAAYLAAGSFHAYVQLDALPSADEVKRLQDLGIRLLSYVGGNTYTAYLSNVDQVNSLIGQQVRWIGEIQVTDKLQPELQRKQFGEWARTPDGLVLIRVSFFEDISTDVMKSLLGDYASASSDRDERLTNLGGRIWSIAIDPQRIEDLAGHDSVLFIEQEPRPLEPLNDVTRDVIDSEDVQGGPPPAYTGLTGAGVQVGVMDSGIDDTHTDFAGRVLRAQAPAGSHGTHVSGTVAASGDRSDDEGGSAFQWRGHAPRAELAVYFYSWARATYDDAIDTHGVDVTNHSHTQTPAPDYSGSTRSVDEAIWDRNLYVVAAAGNNGVNQNNGSPLFGYFSLTGNKGKNPITVGNHNSARGIRNNGSSMGPTFDGRLKPDVTAPGTSITSTVFNDGYGPSTGTSMASPAVTGTVALMLESYFDSFGAATRPLNSTIKAILIHTAADQVQSPARPLEPNNPDTGSPVVYHVGPDWATGYGLVNAARATALIADATGYTEDQIDMTGETDVHTVVVPAGAAEVRVTLAWDDAPGSELTANTAPKLVNDLDLVLEAPDGTVHQPFVLPPLVPETPVGGIYTGVDPVAAANIVPATTGPDHLNNVEQVVVASPGSGNWMARVSGFSVPVPVQRYSIVMAQTTTSPPPPPLPPGNWSISAHIGINEPLGSASNLLDPDISSGIDLEYMFNSQFAAELFIGQDSFSGQTGIQGVDVNHVALNAKWYFMPGANNRPVVGLGIGQYNFSPGPTDFGVNAMIGGQFNITPAFALELTGKYHNVDTSGSSFEYLTLHAGVRWRF